MELRRLSTLCVAFVLLAVFSQCSEARHSMHRREADENDDVNYEDPFLADEASDDEAQNDDADGGDGGDDTIDNATIVTKPTKYNVTVGRTMRLECKIDPADKSIVVEWAKDGVKYFVGNQKAGAPSRYTIEPGTTNLMIFNVEPADSGTYTCTILQGTPAYIEHTVAVTESPRIIRFSATNKGSVLEGSNLLLTCEVSGTPTPQVVFSRQGSNGNERLQEKDGEFTQNSVYMKNVKREHSGKYYCYAFNGVGHSQAELTVNISGKPRVHLHKTVVNSAINVIAVLECSTHEESSVHIRWYKDGRLIEDTSNQFTVSTYGSQSNLTVVPKNEIDFGTFTCEAENMYGKHNRSVELVQTPVIEGVQVQGSLLRWNVQSHQPLQDIEIQLRDINKNGEWTSLNLSHIIPDEKGPVRPIICPLEKFIEDGKYEVVIKVKNENGWSSLVDPVVVDIDSRSEKIQTASVFHSGNGVPVVRSTWGVFGSTMLTFLLVRMLIAPTH